VATIGRKEVESMKSHRTLTALGTALGLVLAFGGLGCQSETGGEDEPSVAEQALGEGAPAPDSAEAEEAGGPRARHHERMGHHGPDKLLRAALKELDLSAEQRATIEGSLETLRQGFERGDHAERKKALAEAVRAGSVDPAALSRGGDHEAKMKESRGKVVAALDQLHATLMPEQRTQLVEALQSRMKAHGDPKKRRAFENDEGKASPAYFALRGIDMSPDQRAKIDAALAAKGLDQPPDGMEGFAAVKERKAAMLEAFAKDSFEASAVLPASGPDFAAGKRHFIEVLAVVVPLLDESQRAELAERIEHGPKHMKKGKRGPMGDRRRGGMRAPLPTHHDQL
jgi:Spy/CpxP family protein refolding chaperone